MQLTQDQLNELEGIYNLSVGNKDEEIGKLMKALKNTISFINFDTSIECFYRWTAGWGEKKVHYGGYFYKQLKEIPITVLLYFLTKDDKYLGTYSKAKYKNRDYIYHGGNCYFVDNLYVTMDPSNAIIK